MEILTMFTGIIEEVGSVATVHPLGNGRRFSIVCPRLRPDAAIGDSISVNGVCLTVVHLSPMGFDAEAVGETLGKTTLGRLSAGDGVNLESALRAGGKLGGHVVQGHVDFRAQITGIETRPESHLVSLSYPASFRHHMVPQGSVSVDGVSLTIARRDDRAFTVAVIPHTWAETTFHKFSVAREVNVEVDIFGKYIIDYLSRPDAKPEGLTAAYLRELGY
jgi:riboflavin synthase